MMYQPAQGPQRRSSRSGLSALAVTLMCTVSMLAGCVGGALVASVPDPSTTAAASPHQTRAAVSEGPSAQETGRSATPRRTATRAAKPTPRRTTVKPKPKPKRTTAPSADPRFKTCAAAKRAGYGPYRRGVDPEYAWYQDRDHDGTVCE